MKPDEVPVPEEDLRKFTGTYHPGKIHMEVKNGELYLVRVNQNIRIELYCIGPSTFIRRYGLSNVIDHISRKMVLILRAGKI